MAVEFTVEIPSRADAQAVAAFAQKAGYRTAIDLDEEDGVWTCYCARDMIVTYEAVVAAQQELGRPSEPHGGHCVGWGSFGNALAE
jgi:hypothetical protein